MFDSTGYFGLAGLRFSSLIIIVTNLGLFVFISDRSNFSDPLNLIELIFWINRRIYRA